MEFIFLLIALKKNRTTRDKLYLKMKKKIENERHIKKHYTNFYVFKLLVADITLTSECSTVLTARLCLTIKHVV